MRNVVIALLVAWFLAAVPAGSASARDLFKSGVAGIAVGDQSIAGIGGGFPWDVTEGEAKVSSKRSGRITTLEVEVEGLVLTATGTVGPVLEVFASLVCQKTEAVGEGEPTNEVVASTENVPLSAAGNAEIAEVIELPDVCVAPIVLIRVGLVDFIPVPIPGPWIAASGL